MKTLKAIYSISLNLLIQARFNRIDQQLIMGINDIVISQVPGRILRFQNKLSEKIKLTFVSSIFLFENKTIINNKSFCIVFAYFSKFKLDNGKFTGKSGLAFKKSSKETINSICKLMLG